MKDKKKIVIIAAIVIFNVVLFAWNSTNTRSANSMNHKSAMMGK